MTASAPLDPHRLAALYQTHTAAHRILDVIAARDGAPAETTVETLLQDAAVDRPAAIDALRQLAMAGCGDFIVGRRGAPTRFRWIAGMNRLGDLMARGEVPPASAAVAAAVRAPAHHAPAPHQPPDAPMAPDEAPEPDETRPALVTHRFQLRPDLVIQLHLPRDLTTREAERLGMFIDSLPFA